MVRTRFAPSPTGYMHIGNLRTALYAYCIAKHNQGTFILRIEDTDRKRNVPKAIQVIYDSLRLAGLEYDEGPGAQKTGAGAQKAGKEGGFGPYIQSQRKEAGVYQRQAELLLELGGAYRCFCAQGAGGSANLTASPGLPPARAARARRDPCGCLTQAEVQAHLDNGDAFVIRQRIPAEGSTTFHDLVFGAITVKNSTLDEQVLVKSDGFPTYNFANVVDDHLMEITHVARGVEYLSSTPKYNLLYTSFGWEIPAYIHLPHIIKADGKKLSKRAGDASFQDLLARGYLPEAIVNYIALLGWSPGDDREYFDLAGLVEAFDVNHINKSSAAFSAAKLDWLNGEHIRQLSPERFHEFAEKHYPAQVRATCTTSVISRMLQQRTTRFGDIPAMIQFLAEVAPYDADLYTHVKSKSTLASSLQVMREVMSDLVQLETWNEETIRQALVGYATQTNLKTSTVMWPVRVALSGLQTTPGGALEIAAALGKEETLERLEKAVRFLQEKA